MTTPARVSAAILLAALAASVSGCAYVDYGPPAPLAEAAPDRALVYFYNEGRSPIDGVLGVPIGVGELIVGALVSGSYFALEVSPGTHLLWAETVKRSTLTLDAEAGRRYFVRMDLGPGLVAPRPHLRLVAPADAAIRVETLRPVQPAYPWVTEPPTFHGSSLRSS